MTKEAKAEVGEFGALTASYAIRVLPDRNHPQYQEDKIIEHLADFKETFIDLLESFETGQGSPNLEDRFIPLSRDDIKEMAKLSFRRGKLLLKSDWEYLEKDSKILWGILFPYNPIDPDLAYRYWTVHEMEPSLAKNGYKLLCVEIDQNFTPDYGKEIEYEVGFLSRTELRAFIKNVTRHYKNKA